MINNQKRKQRKTVMMIISLVIIVAITTMSVCAEGLLDSKLVTGTQKLVQDASTVLSILCPLIGGVAYGVCMGRKAAAEEQDQPMWKKRATQAIIAGVGGCLGNAIIAAVAHYYK